MGMPIYEFCCNSCGTAFEELVRNGVQPVCSSCGSCDVQRLLSTFAVHSSSADMGGKGATKSCSTCASSSCATCH
jgi:putative FmdB family regulatory protein